jgi:hypothetical protein
MARLLIALAAFCAASGALAQQPAPPACDAAEHRAFDFWIGEWDVYVTGTETLAGQSTIRSEDAGCVISEHWRSARAAYSGRSLNIYDRATGQWNQFWVDSTGEVTRFVGGPHEGGMRLTDPANLTAGQRSPLQTRMTFTANADGSVRQHGETSPDGIAWTSRYDFTYRRRAQQEPSL